MTLDELTTPMTVDEAKASIYASLEASGVSTTTWKPGAVVRTIITCLAIILAAFSRLQALLAKSGFLELAEADWLTLVALYVYNVTRSTGSFASGDVEFDNASGNVYSGVAGDLIVTNSTTGKTYRNTAPYTIGALATNVLIPFQAVELGSESTATPGAIDAMATPLIGVTVANPTALVGLDAESDPDLRSRCAAKLGTLSPSGARDAYEFIAKSAVNEDGSPVGVNRVRTIPDGVGGVNVYVATASGSVSGVDTNPATPLGAVAKAIWEQVEPLAITAYISSATPYVVPVTYELWVREPGGMTEVQIEQAVSDALVEYFANVPIGGDVIGAPPGYIFKSAIVSLIGSVRPDTVRVDVTLPAGDSALLVANAPVAGVITATAIHILEP
jgi:phage-related baseplate assembly protein